MLNEKLVTIAGLDNACDSLTKDLTLEGKYIEDSGFVAAYDSGLDTITGLLNAELVRLKTLISDAHRFDDAELG
jgi:hypothetical protein